MKKATLQAKKTGAARISPKQLPIIVEKGEDGLYVVECPVLQGCYTQGKTIDEALRNIREVIALLLEEEEARAILRDYPPTEISLQAISLNTVEHAGRRRNRTRVPSHFPRQFDLPLIFSPIPSRMQNEGSSL